MCSVMYIQYVTCCTHAGECILHNLLQKGTRTSRNASICMHQRWCMHPWLHDWPTVCFCPVVLQSETIIWNCKEIPGESQSDVAWSSAVIFNLSFAMTYNQNLHKKGETRKTLELRCTTRYKHLFMAPPERANVLSCKISFALKTDRAYGWMR